MNSLIKQKSSAPLISIFVISTFTLAYEVLLTRLLSIVQWHHFAYMIISIALLGYGASGAFLTIFRESLKRYFFPIYLLSIILFSVTSLSGFLFLQYFPFNPLELFWDASQLIWLSVMYVLLMLPFFFSANCIGLVLFLYREQINFSYAADLLGAALGALGIVYLLQWFFPITTLQIIASSAGLAALITIIELKANKAAILTALLIMVFPWTLPQTWLQLKPSEFKPLMQTLNINGAKVIEETSSPLGVLSVVKNQQIPFRYVPGVALNNTSIPPEQLAIFFDADAMSPITYFDGNIASLDYLANTTSALAYRLLEKPDVLVLGAGGGAEVLQAKYFHANKIDAVELNNQLIELMKNDFSDFSGDIYNMDNVKVHIDEARRFLQTSRQEYDLIQMSLMDSFAASTAGLYALSESYLYTIEAMQLYLSRLTDNGVLSLTRWVKLPPRDTLKLITTAKQALINLGIEDPKQHIALIRSWNTTTLIVKRSPLSITDKQNIVNFSQSKSFDLAYYPGIKPLETNRYNILPQAYFYQGAIALLADDNSEFLTYYKYNLQAATDNKPYFFHFLKWESLPEILDLPANQGLPLIEWGTIILFATLLQAIVTSVFFILAPLWIHYRRQKLSLNLRTQAFTFSYFILLGVAFMFMEMAFIQRFILFLGHPTYAIAVVLTGFLFFAGLGSAISKKWHGIKALKIAVTGILLFAILYLLVLPGLFAEFIDKTDRLKIFITLGLIAPLALFMGMPFPHGLGLLSRLSPAHIPWAWGINGCASVISAIGATMLAIHFGFTSVILLAIFFYLCAGLLFIRESGKIPSKT